MNPATAAVDISANVMTGAEVLRRAQNLVPVLRARAEAAEKMRRCPDETVEDFIANGLLRLCQPKSFGGYELSYDLFCETSQTLARGCGSQAWVHMVFTDNALKLAAYSLQAQQEVWGQNRDALLSNSVAPVGKGRPVEGGVVWSGRHGFSSGVDHAHWVMASGHVDRGDRKQACAVLVPKSDITVIDDWHVVGLAGSGSKSFEIKDVFVPEHRILDKKTADEGRAPGTQLYSAPIFHLPRGGISTSTYCSVVVGIAEGFLEEYCKYTGPRKSRGTSIAGLAGTQIVVGLSSAEIEAAGRMYLGTLREALDTMARGEKVGRLQNIQGKRNAAYAAQLSIAAVQRLFNAAGGRALYTDNAMQRMLRDCYAAAAHHSLMWDTAAAAYGRGLLGIEDDSGGD
jgi:3-hydroxy-9,10-secoandrosta-1,3,5(10)-triene-9,17-dione monooxygenase